MYEPVHPNCTSILEVVPVDVAPARQPVRRIVIDAGTLQLEQRIRRSIVVKVVDSAQFVIDSILKLFFSFLSDVFVVGNSLGIEHSKVVVERVVLLEQEEDV